MRFATVAALVGSASAAISFGPGGESSGWGEGSAPNGTVYTTDVVTAFTTYCPEATQLTHNGQTYTITEATTLTITNCPCTVTKPVYSSVVTSCSTCSSTPAAPVSETPSSSPVAPASYSSPASSPAAPVSYSSPAPYVSANGTTTAPAGTAPAGTGSPVTTPASSPVSPATGSPIASYTGAATKAQVAGVSFLALLGLVAAL